MLNKKDYINFGSSRIVFNYDEKYIIKYPLFSLGIDANKEEYNNYLKNKEVVAKSVLLDNGLLLQEKLNDCYEFSRQEVNSGNIDNLLFDRYGYEGLNFTNNLLDKKLCLGKDLNNKLKQYDCENIKGESPEYYMKKDPHLLFDESMIDDFIEFINKLDSENVNKHFYKEYKKGLDNPFNK